MYALQDYNNHDLVINCLTNSSVQQNSNIAWARVLYSPVFEITETFKYSINPFELIIHNVTGNDLGTYACYAEDTYTVYKVIYVTAIECKYYIFIHKHSWYM